MQNSAKQFEALDVMAKKWRVSVERLKNACDQGDVEGAALLNGEWIIPSDMKRPTIKTLPQKQKPPRKYADGKGEIIARTAVQEAVIDAVDKGHNLASVSEYRIGNTTYIVSGIFKRQGPTLEEKVFDLIMREAQDKELISKFPDADARKAIQEDRDNIRRKSPVFTMTKEEKMDHYRKMLASYGFNEDEIERLMVKIEADYEEPDFDTRFSYKPEAV